MTEAGVEVAICSHNGSARLPAVLQALAAQTLPDRAWGVLLVDNASTDDTAGAARRAWSRPGVTLRIISEPHPGLNFARQRTLAEVARPLVCFCDDDNLLAPDYLEQAINLMEQLPLVGVLGGKGEAVSESPLPEWFSAAARSYAVGPQADAEGEVSISGGCLYGAGMILRLSAWDRLKRSGFKPRLLGREGSQVGSGDDNELCLALFAMGWRLHYSHRLIFQHVIPARRLNEAYCRALYRGFGEAKIVLNAYRDFALGRASPSAWRSWASMRLAQSWLVRASDLARRANSTALTAASHEAVSEHERNVGFAAGHRKDFKGGRLFGLYGSIAAWLAAARKIPE
jgi:glycosyltransferase involved in cell wall biosynthesis